MAFGEVRIGALDLDKTLAADGLVTATSMVEIRGICEEADGALDGVLVQKYFDRLAIHERVMGELNLARHELGRRAVAGVGTQHRRDGLPAGFQKSVRSRRDSHRRG